MVQHPGWGSELAGAIRHLGAEHLLWPGRRRASGIVGGDRGQGEDAVGADLLKTFVFLLVFLQKS